MGTSIPINSSIWIINEQLITCDIYIGNFELLLYLLTLNVNSCTVTILEQFLTRVPLQQLNGPLQNNSKLFLLFFLLVCCIPRVTQLKSWIKHHVGKTSLDLITFNQFQNQSKTRFMTKNHTAKTICHLFSWRPYWHNRCVQNALFIKTKCTLWFWVDCWS